MNSKNLINWRWNVVILWIISKYELQNTLKEYVFLYFEVFFQWVFFNMLTDISPLENFSHE